MTTPDIEAVKRELTAEIQHWQSLGPPMTRTEALHQNSLATITALQARVDEAERERDEARRLLSACGDESTACWNNLVKAGQQRDQARADLATLRAAVDEAVDALKAYDDATPEHGDDCRVGPYYHCTCDLRVAHEKARELRGRLRNLTKPETPSERIMSDKDRENPVEGAHPTQPEPDAMEERALATADRLARRMGGTFVRTQPEPDAHRDTAWLIERDGLATVESGNRPALHYYAEHRPGRGWWTPDHNKAKRFATKAEAERETNGDPLLRVAEHMWLGSTQPEPDADPLVAALNEMGVGAGTLTAEDADRLHAALAARSLEVRKVGEGKA